jgi:hypothetical protein
MKTLFNSLKGLCPLALLPLFASGCAQYMCIHQPKPFTPSTTQVGTRRTAIIGELGEPVNSEPHGTNLVDTFKYVDGGAKNSGGAKTARVVIYTAGDVFTLFLDQVIWIPSEKFGFAGKDHVVIVDYAKSEDDFWRAFKIDDQELKGRSTKTE